MQEHGHLFPIRRMCVVLEVSENGYYNWRKRGESQRKRDDKQITECIEDAYSKNRGTYGSPRIHVELKEQGIFCGRKRVARLMREHHLIARRKRRKAQKTDSHHDAPIAPDLLARNFSADAPNTKWVTDLTFIETQEGWLYLAGVLDLFSRKIVGWAMGKEHDTTLALQALEMALAGRQPGAGLIHHSDRGSEYASRRYRDRLHQRGIQMSMSRRGDCYDNAPMESFWSTLKEEGLGQHVYQTRKEAKAVVFEYVEVFYNRKRKHSSLGYLSPIDYEKQQETKNISIIDISFVNVAK